MKTAILVITSTLLMLACNSYDYQAAVCVENYKYHKIVADNLKVEKQIIAECKQDREETITRLDQFLIECQQALKANPEKSTEISFSCNETKQETEDYLDWRNQRCSFALAVLYARRIEIEFSYKKQLEIIKFKVN